MVAQQALLLHMHRARGKLTVIGFRTIEESKMHRDGIFGRGALGVAVGLVLSAALVLAAPAVAQEEEGGLAVGDTAPDFSLKGSDGETYTLAQFKGEKNVILAFFPKAFTGG